MQSDRLKIGEAAQAIRNCWPHRPVAGLVLGTGLGEVAADLCAEAVLDYRQIPHFRAPTAVGHRGRLVCGLLAEKRVVVLDGRCHRYEGHSPEQLAFPIRVLAALNASVVILSNASGALQPHFACGDVMLIEDHIGLLFGRLPDWQANFAGRAQRPNGQLYDPLLIKSSIFAARKAGFLVHRGVYAAVSGPNYETRAEYRFLRRIGADTVGMSTIPEALAARACGLRTLALSVITNVARPDSPQAVSSAHVVAAAAVAAAKVRVLVENCVRECAGPDPSAPQRKTAPAVNPAQWPVPDPRRAVSM